MSKKDTIYLEPDDEITTVIDKLQQSEQQVVALVLPQRANVFQSVVNMKLLKKSATKAKKQIALVTSDPTVMKLAGLSSIHVAKNLQSKPEIPAVEELPEPEPEQKEDEAVKVAAATAAGAAVLDEVIELDNSAPAKAAKPAVKKGSKPKKKIKIPDFGSFRSRLFLGVGLLVLLIIGGIFAFLVLPKATIFIKTDTKGVDVSVAFQATTETSEFDLEKAVVPAVLAETSKTDTEKVPATGQKNIGQPAAGSVKFKAKVCVPNLGNTPSAIASGSTVTAGGKNYITQAAMTFAFTGFSGGSCANYETANGDITAASPGEAYNVSGGSFTVAGRSDASGTGSASGGTDEVVKVVTSADIDKAKESLAGRSKSAAFEELKANLSGQQLRALEQTLEEGAPKIDTSAKVDDQAEEVTVTSTTAYKMLGVKDEYLSQLLDKAVNSQMDDQKQKIQDNGLGSATFSVQEKTAANNQKMQMQTVATVGPDMDIEAIRQMAAGKKRGDIQDEIGRIDGVRDVTVEYSPFWVLQTPSSPSKIEVVLEQSGE